MNKRFSIVEAGKYAMKATINNLGLYFLSMLATIGITITSIIILAGSYVLILANQSSAFQDVLRLYFSGKAYTIEQGKAIATAESAQLLQTVLSTISPFMVILCICCILLFILILSAIVAGYIRMLLVLHDTGKASLHDFIAGFTYSPWLYITNALAIITASIPFISITIPVSLLELPAGYRISCLVIGAICSLALGARFYLSQYFFMDDKETIIGSLKASWRATKDNWLSMIVLISISGILLSNSMLSLLSFFPFTLMMIYVYRLQVPTQQSSSHETPEPQA